MRKYVLNLNSLLVFTLILFAVGCTKEEIVESNDSAKLSFRINTKAIINESMDGVTINSIRIIISDPSLGNNIIVNRLIDDANAQADDFQFQLKQGRYRICVIANETTAMTSSLAAVTKLSDLDAITVVTPSLEGSLVLYQAIDIQLRALASNPAQAEVSVNGGADWIPPLVTVKLQRVASKISLSIKKKTNNPGDKFDIKKVELINLASSSYLLPGRTYTGGVHTDVAFNGSAVSFVNNDEVKSIFQNYIVSEYLLPRPDSSDDASALVITAVYTSAGGTAKEVVYTVPVLGHNAANYSLKRNCHYNITATITQTLESNSFVTIEYDVLPWTVVGNGSFETGAITFTGDWATGTAITGHLIEVSNNTSVTYEFTLSFPPGAIWKAQLTNFQDFDFDLNNNGVREGITAEGIVHKIRIRPRAAVSANDVMTEFYITVFNGIENIEVDLLGDGKTGVGNRFIIKQNPN